MRLHHSINVSTYENVSVRACVRKWVCMHACVGKCCRIVADWQPKYWIDYNEGQTMFVIDTITGTIHFVARVATALYAPCDTCSIFPSELLALPQLFDPVILFTLIYKFDSATEIHATTDEMLIRSLSKWNMSNVYHVFQKPLNTLPILFFVDGTCKAWNHTHARQRGFLPNEAQLNRSIFYKQIFAK